MPSYISPFGASELSTEHSDAPLRLSSYGIHQMFKEMCRYFENHTQKKLSTKQPVKIRALMIQLCNYWGPDHLPSFSKMVAQGHQ